MVCEGVPTIVGTAIIVRVQGTVNMKRREAMVETRS